MDFDSDGIKDLILGNRTGTVLFYKRDSGLSLQSGVSLNDANGIIKVNNNSKPTIIDWNDDGLLDLILSAGDTTQESITGAPIRIYLNEGSVGNYEYGNSSELTAAGETLMLRRCYSQIIDFNGDGRLDLIASEKDYENWGGNSKILFFENNNTNGAFDFKQGLPFKYESGEDIIVPGDAHFCFSDWNGDGTDELIWTQYPGATPEDYVYVSYVEGSVANKNSAQTINTDKFTKIKFSTKNRNLKLSSCKQITEIKVFDLSGKLILLSNNFKNQIQIPTKLLNRFCIVKVSGNDWNITKKVLLK